MKKKSVFLLLFLGLTAFWLIKYPTPAFSVATVPRDFITITTYFPAPMVVYLNLTIDRLTVGYSTPVSSTSGNIRFGNSATSKGLLSRDQGGSIELGGTSGTERPYIDFSRSASDYDARIQLWDSNTLRIEVRNKVEIRDTADPSAWEDIYVRKIHYYSGAFTGVIEKNNLSAV